MSERAKTKKRASPQVSRRGDRYPSAAQLAARRKWAQSVHFCWVCRRADFQFGVVLEVHEIASRARAPRQWADVRNYFRACSTCHREVLSWLDESTQLAMKLLHDPDNYDREFINAVRGRAPEAIEEHSVRLWTKFLRAVQT